MGIDSKGDIPLYRKEFSAFDGKSPEQKIQELADREEIRELISHYAHCVAQGVSVAHTFTDDGEYIVRFPGYPNLEKRGRKELDENFAELEGTPAIRLPMIHNYVIEVSGDEARGICSNELRMTDKGQSKIGSGYYQDKFRREKGRWKFTVRDMTFMHYVPIQKGWTTVEKPK